MRGSGDARGCPGVLVLPSFPGRPRTRLLIGACTRTILLSPGGLVQVGAVSHLFSQLTARGVWAHGPPRVVMTAEGTLGVPEQQLCRVDAMGLAQPVASAPWEGQGEVLGPSHQVMTVESWGPFEGQGTFFWPALLCYPRPGPPIITHITNPAPAVPVLGPARSLNRERAFLSHSSLSIHHPSKHGLA